MSSLRLPPQLGAFAAFGLQVIIAATFFVIYGVGLAVATGVHHLNHRLAAPG